MAVLRAGVVGVGYLGNYHAQKYYQLPDVNLCMLADPEANRRHRLALKYHCKAVSDHRQLIGQVDLVSIAAPTSAHYALACDFLEAGIHVLLEKPMADTPAQAADLCQRARKHQCLLQIGHLERFNPAFVAAREQVRRPQLIEARRLSPFKARGADIDVVLDLMIHDIDLMLCLLDSPVVDVQASGVTVVSDQVDAANARLVFANGTVASLSASRINDVPVRKFHIYENDHCLTLDSLNNALHRYQRSLVNSPAHSPINSASHAPPDQFSQRYAASDPLLDEIRAFVRAVKSHSCPPVSGEDGLKALDLACRIREQLADQVSAVSGASSAQHSQIGESINL